VTPSIRIMTWNVHGTFSLKRSFDLPGVISLVERWSPDIVALQEIDSRGRNDNPFSLLDAALSGHSVGAKSIVTADGDYGQMLISRWPWATSPLISDISHPEREPRKAIAADVKTPQGQLRVISTHLGLSVRERHHQAKVLLRLGQDVNTPAIVLGDFNDWFWVNSVRGVLAQNFPIRTRHRTFPSAWPVMRLDRIYGRDITIVGSKVDRAAVSLSDHLPVIADIKMNRDGSA